MWVSFADGSRQHQLVPDLGDSSLGEPGGPPAWTASGVYYTLSPHAGEDRFYGITDGGGAIYRTGPQGGASSLVLGGYQAGLAGSPSGRYLAFSRRSLFILDLRNHRLRRVTHGPEDFNPSWSPNGQTILYIHASNPTTGVATAEMAMLDVRTGRSTLLPWTRGARLTQPAFIP